MEKIQRTLDFPGMIKEPLKTKLLKSSSDQNTSKQLYRHEKRYKLISLFSGCGGMDLGFLGGFRFLEKYYEKLFFDIVWANEINPKACLTYSFNLGRHIHCGNIWDYVDSIPTNTDVVIGGFPCQDISINGKQAGLDGKRSGLYRAMVEVVKRTNPFVFVAENVRGLLMKRHREALRRVFQDFTELGYEVSHKLYNAAGFGVPQTRERVFIIGTKPGLKFSHPQEIFPKSHYISASKAMADLELQPEDESINHIWSKANKSPEQGNRRLKSDRPGYTIRAECHGNIQFHYNQPRRISMREAARIQSFPDNFIFQAKLRETERQIGNAVPPVLAWHIAKAVQSTLRTS